MMYSKMAFRLQGLGNIRNLGALSLRWQSTPATPLTEPLDNLPPGEPYRRPSPEPVKVTKLSSGLTVASLETFSPVSSAGIFIKAGSRYETSRKEGLTHLLRTCAYQSTSDKSAFRISREIEQLGGSLSSTTTREHVLYTANFMRGYLEVALETLGSVATNTNFKRWEVDDQKPRMAMDLALLQAQPNAVLMEEVHKYAFRTGLCNPIYSPPHNVSALSHEDLNNYVKKNFSAERMTLVGIGVNHDELVSMATQFFKEVPSGTSEDRPKAEYIGGGESRVSAPLPVTHAVIGCQGASISDEPKTVLTAGVLQYLLGGLSTVKWGSNTAAGRLGKAVGSTLQGPFAVNAFNIGYSDNGLFGIYAIADGNNMETLLRTVFKEFKNVAIGNIEPDLPRAKNQLKTAILMGIEQQGQYLADIGLQVSLRGSYTDPQEALGLIDAVTAQDVAGFARKILSTKSTLCCHGDISSIPRLDALLAELK